MSLIDQIIERLYEKKINVRKVLSRTELIKRISKTENKGTTYGS